MKLNTLANIIRVSDELQGMLDTSSSAAFHDSLAKLSKGDAFKMFALVKKLKNAADRLEEEDVSI